MTGFGKGLVWDTQNHFYENGTEIICGCDEAGRGSLAGPVFAAAVVLPRGLVIDGLGDSKALSPSKRELLYGEIRRLASGFAVAHAEVYEIEAVNILNASMLAMRRAICQLYPIPDLALIDGNIARDFPIKAIPVPKGDGVLPSVAAASILAKVERDRFCGEMDSFYPGYNFAKNKGYATREHREAIIKNGPSPIHRKSFLRKTLGAKSEQLDIWQSW